MSAVALQRFDLARAIDAKTEKRRVIGQMTGVWFGHEFLLGELVRQPFDSLTISYI